MTTARSYLLQIVGHWRWLTKQDMRKWLESELSTNYTKVDNIMKDMDRYVNFYWDFSFRRHLEESHRQEAVKRQQNLMEVSTKYANYNMPDELMVRKFGEDGKWHEKRIKVPLDSLNPSKNDSIRDEYMRKALDEEE